MTGTPDENPIFIETKQVVTVFKRSLAQYLGALDRSDEGGASMASAQAVGSYRKLVAIYRSLTEDLRQPLDEPLFAMHMSLKNLSLPVGDSPVPEPSLEHHGQNE
jgi:hypothetical protein